MGLLVLKSPWPAMLRTVYKDDERYRKYWYTIENYYAVGDLAVKGKDGYIMILGRADDIIIVAGHNIGTAEVESALVSHQAVAEAAVIGKPDPVKGNSIKAFVILRVGFHNRVTSWNRTSSTMSATLSGRLRCRTRSNSSTSCPRPGAGRSCAGS